MVRFFIYRRKWIAILASNYVGISMAYYFNRNFSLRTFANYSVRNSNDPNATDYHESNGGAGASLKLAF